MEVLEHQDQRCQPTARLHERLQQFARTQTDQNAVKTGQRALWGLEAEHIEQQREIFRGAQAETLETFVEFARDNGFRISGPQTEGATHDLDESPEGRLLAVGRAAPHQDPRALLDDLPEEFVHEPRFADTRLSDDVENLDAGADRVESALQLLQLGVAPDKGCEAAVEFGAEARRSLADRVEPVGLLRLGFAFDVMLAKEAALDQSL